MKEKEMKKGFQEVDDSALEAAAGGYMGKDKYSKAEYSKAGVSWNHNIFSKDEYYYDGTKISQSDAEAIVTAYNYGMRKKPN